MLHMLEVTLGLVVLEEGTLLGWAERVDLTDLMLAMMCSKCLMLKKMLYQMRYNKNSRIDVSYSTIVGTTKVWHGP